MDKSILLLIGITLVGTFAQVDEYEKAIAELFTTPDTDFLNQYTVVTTTEKNRGDFGAIERCGQGKDAGVHMCVSYYNCDADTKTIIPSEDYDGTGLIDIRFGSNTCENYLEVCCKIVEGQPLPPEVTTKTPGETPTPPPVIPPEEPTACGIRNPNGVDFKITGNNANEAEYGEFPWMLAILDKNYIPSGNRPLALCGGSLIAPNLVLTGAHCVFKNKVDEISVRAGEWDTQTERERYPYQERDVQEIITHENFAANNLFNDVALLVLERPFDRAPHIGTICLPPKGLVFNSRECFASGWGKNIFGQKGIYQVILKKIQLPIVQKNQCQQALRNTRLGGKFKLHESFICAGGIAGVDTCTGDGGSPLVCPDPNNPKRYVQAGMVAWGIGCGEDGVPGVYVDVAHFRDWIDRQVKRLSIDSSAYNV